MGEDPGRIRQEIEETRGQMGDTVEALAHKADVPGRVKESLSDKRDRVMGAMSGAGSKISDATPSTGDVKQGASQAVSVAQENPLSWDPQGQSHERYPVLRAPGTEIGLGRAPGPPGISPAVAGYPSTHLGTQPIEGLDHVGSDVGRVGKENPLGLKPLPHFQRLQGPEGAHARVFDRPPSP